MLSLSLSLCAKTIVRYAKICMFARNKTRYFIHEQHQNLMQSPCMFGLDDDNFHFIAVYICAAVWPSVSDTLWAPPTWIFLFFLVPIECI